MTTAIALSRQTHLSLRVHYLNLVIVIVPVLKSKDLYKYSCRQHKLNCGKKSSFHEQNPIIQLFHTLIFCWPIACENIRFSSLFAAGDFPSGEERVETDFAG